MIPAKHRASPFFRYSPARRQVATAQTETRWLTCVSGEKRPMPSAAHSEWTGIRAQHIDELLVAHSRVGGVGPGRRWRTTQLNLAITMRLAAEFQGFSRSLHDESCDFLCDQTIKSNQAIYRIFRSNLTHNRTLDRGNASAGGVGSDFARLGLLLWPALAATEPKANFWNKSLDELNVARNAIAHDDQAGFSKLPTSKYPITLTVIRSWRRSLDGLARTMDTVVGDYLTAISGGQRPW